MKYLFHILILINIYILVSISLNLIVGYCGFLSLAHAGYFAIGSYSYAILSLNSLNAFNTSIPLMLFVFVAIGVGILITVFLSLLLFLPSLKFKGDLFVIVTLALQALIFSILSNWSTPGAELGSWKNLTNGMQGISGIPKLIVLEGSSELIKIQLFFLTLAITLIFLIVYWLFLRSRSSHFQTTPLGRLLKSIRDDSLAVRGLGKVIWHQKFWAFSFSCILASLAGAMYAFSNGSIDPKLASIDHAIFMLSMVIIGGSGNVLGPVVGAVLLVMLQQFLTFIPLPFDPYNAQLLLYGLLMVLILHFRPQGLVGEYRIR